MDINKKIKKEIIERTLKYLPEPLQVDFRKVLESDEINSMAFKLFDATIRGFNEIAEEYATEQIGALKAVLAYMLKDKDEKEILLKDEVLKRLKGYNVIFQQTEDGNCIVKLIGTNIN